MFAFEVFFCNNKLVFLCKFNFNFKFKAEPHKLPDEFERIGPKIGAQNRSKFTNENMIDEHGFYENPPAVYDKDIVFSHDSIWHAPDQNFKSTRANSTSYIQKGII